MTMRRLAQQLEPFLHSVQRVPVVDLLLAAAFGMPTWLLAAAGGLTTVYVVAGSGGDWSATGLLLTALAAGTAVAGIATALTFVWVLVREIWRQWHRPSEMASPPASHPGTPATDDDLVPTHAETESRMPARAQAQPEIAPVAPAIRPVPPPKKTYLASELRSRLRALAEISQQLDGSMQDAFDFGHAMAMHIGDACRNNSKQEIIDRFNIFKAFTEAAQKDLIATVKKYPFPEIAEIGPWDCGPVVDKTGVLTLLMPVVPEQVLRNDNFSTPALRQAGADWISAVNGFGAWLADKKRKLAAQRAEYESAQLQE